MSAVKYLVNHTVSRPTAAKEQRLALVGRGLGLSLAVRGKGGGGGARPELLGGGRTVSGLVLDTAPACTSLRGRPAPGTLSRR